MNASGSAGVSSRQYPSTVGTYTAREVFVKNTSAFSPLLSRNQPDLYHGVPIPFVRIRMPVQAVDATPSDQLMGRCFR